MFPTTRTRRLLGTAALALALVGGTACGAEGDDDDATSTTTEAAGASTTTTDDEPTTDEPTTDEPTGDRDAYVEALVGTFDDEDEEIFGPGKAECIANGFIDVIGMDNIEESGLSPQEFAEGDGTDFPPALGLDEDKANDLYDVFGECDIDLVETLVDLYGSMGELTPEQETCVTDILTEDNLRTSFVADFLGEDLEDDPLDEVGTCMGFDDDPSIATPETPQAEPVVPGN